MTKFKNFLASQKLSPTTQKNYLTDVRCFWRWYWITLKRESRADSPPKQNLFFKVNNWFSFSVLWAFKESLIAAGASPATINRRLSGLKKFGDFLVDSGWLRENPAQKVGRVKLKKEDKWKKILNWFKQDLKNQGRSKTTIKNYLGDVRQFLRWASTGAPA